MSFIVLRRRIAALVAALAALLVLAGGAPALNRYPTLWLVAPMVLGQSGGAELDVSNLDAAPSPEQIAITVPGAYGVSLAHAVGSVLGRAQAWTPGNTAFAGPLVELGPAAFAASASGQTCAPGHHAAVWEMRLKSRGGASLSLPIAIDRSSRGTRISLCFDDVRAKGVALSEVDFSRNGGFTAPTHGGKYLFDATVTPFAADGTPDPTTAYELRAYEPLPRDISIEAAYSTSAKTLTVTGAATSQRKAAPGQEVILWTGNTPGSLTRSGTTTNTDGHGRFTFKRRLAKAPRYADVEIDNAGYESCPGSSPAPAGCASYSIGKTDSGYVRVTKRG